MNGFFVFITFTKKNMANIVFMGTPEFAVPSLEAIINAGHQVSAVVTPPDRPAGRGRKLKACPVKQFALENKLLVLQPEKLRDENFIKKLQSLQPEIIVVVAFRMLPEVVWAIPPRGTFNLHSSLLPDYRGAAPMNHAIINGEKTTGVTTFFLDKEIDTGKILLREKIPIDDEMNVGELHDKLMVIGAHLVVKTIDAIMQNNFLPIDQSSLTQERMLHPAPKFQKDDLKINWAKPAVKVHDFVRGLSPYPAAFTSLISEKGESFSLKIFKTAIHKNEQLPVGHIKCNGKDSIMAGTADHAIEILELQLAGKRRMKSEDFLRGFVLNNNWKLH